MTRTLYYLNCQVLNESFLQNLLPTVLFVCLFFFFLLLNSTLGKHSWFVFTMCVVGHLIKGSVSRNSAKLGSCKMPFKLSET